MVYIFGRGVCGDVFEQIKPGLDGISLVRLLSTCREARESRAGDEIHEVRNIFCGLARFFDEVPLRWPGFPRGDGAEMWFGLASDERLPRCPALDDSPAPPSFLADIFSNASQTALHHWLARRRRLRGLDPISALEYLNPDEGQSPLFVALLQIFRSAGAKFLYSPEEDWMYDYALDPEDPPLGPVLKIAFEYKGFSAMIYIWWEWLDVDL